MIPNRSAFFLAALTLAPLAIAAKPGSCTDLALQWTIEAGDNTIQGIGGEYVDGTDGVTAILYKCGTRDATVALRRSTGRHDGCFLPGRPLWLRIPIPLPGIPHYPETSNTDVVNTPYMTSKVRVEYTAVTKTWVVTPDNTEVMNGPRGSATSVMSLLYLKRNTLYNAGQFAGIKFRFIIRVK